MRAIFGAMSLDPLPAAAKLSPRVGAMLLYDKPLYLHSCAGDFFKIYVIAFVLVVVGFGLLCAVRSRPSPGPSRSKLAHGMYISGVYGGVLLAVFLAQLPSLLGNPSVREIVRLAARDSQLDVTWCNGPYAQQRQFALGDIVFQQLPEMRGKTLQQTLVLTKRGDVEALGKVDFVESRLNMAALRDVAPAAVRLSSSAEGNSAVRLEPAGAPADLGRRG